MTKDHGFYALPQAFVDVGGVVIKQVSSASGVDPADCYQFTFENANNDVETTVIGPSGACGVATYDFDWFPAEKALSWGDKVIFDEFYAMDTTVSYVSSYASMTSSFRVFDNAD